MLYLRLILSHEFRYMTQNQMHTILRTVNSDDFYL